MTAVFRLARDCKPATIKFMSTVSPVHEETTLDRVQASENDYLLQNYARYPLVLDHGKGCYVFDPSGKRYLDFITGIGVNALGHAHPRLVKVIREQAGLSPAHLQSLLQRLPGPARRASRQSQRSAAHVLLQLRRRVHGRRYQNGARPRPQNQSGEIRRSSRCTIRFTDAHSGRFPSRARKNIAVILSRCFLAPASFRPTMKSLWSKSSVNAPPALSSN